MLKHMKGRLILLNKVYPKTPTLKDIRPIIVLSPIRKFLELHLFDKLQSYLLNKGIKS